MNLTLNIKQLIGKWTWIIAVLLIVWGVSGQIEEHMGTNKQFSFMCLLIFSLFFGMLLEWAKYFSKDPITWTLRRKLRLYIFTAALATIVIGFFTLFSSN